MRRFTLAPIVLVLCGICVAAAVRAQDSQGPNWGKRWGNIKSTIVGEPTDKSGKNHEPRQKSETKRVAANPVERRTTAVASTNAAAQVAPVQTSSRRTAQSEYKGTADSPAVVAPASEPRMAQVTKPIASEPVVTSVSPGSRGLQEKLSAVRSGTAPETAAEAPSIITESTSRTPKGGTIGAYPHVARANPRIDSTASLDRVKTPAADDVLFAHQSPLLNVETVGPRTIVIGKQAAYTISIANSGEVAAQDLVVTVKVPEWADVVNARTTAGSTKPLSQQQNADPFQWKLGRLEAGAKEQLTLTVVPRQSRPFDLAVQWTFSPIASQALVEVQEPKLAVAMSGPDEVLFGQTKVYRLTLSNPGTGEAENVIIDLLPLGDSQDGAARHQLGTIAAGDSKTVEVELTARQPGVITIKAQATADGGLMADVSEEVLVRRAGLQVVAEGPKMKYAGTVGTYSIQVSNPGNATAENVHVSATLPAGAEFISSTDGGEPTEQGQVLWTVPTLRAGASVILEMKCTLNSPGSNRVLVASTADDDLAHTSTAVTNVEALADLKLEVTDPQGPVPVGEEIVYEVRVRNRGSKSAEDIAIVAFFSEGVEPLEVQGGRHETADGRVNFEAVPTMAAGSEVVYKITARAGQPGNHLFRVEVNCRSLGTKLAADETTYFYGEEAVTSKAQLETAARGAAIEPAELSPAPQDEIPGTLDEVQP